MDPSRHQAFRTALLPPHRSGPNARPGVKNLLLLLNSNGSEPFVSEATVADWLDLDSMLMSDPGRVNTYGLWAPQGDGVHIGLRHMPSHQNLHTPLSFVDGYDLQPQSLC